MDSKRAVKWRRRIARGLGSLALVWWLFIGIMKIVFPHAPDASGEGAILGMLMGIAMIGVLIVWWREGVGGMITVIGGIALCIFAWITAGHNKGFAMLVSGGPFLVAGILFLAGWRGRKRGAKEEHRASQR
jgi:hypothetical protein